MRRSKREVKVRAIYSRTGVQEVWRLSYAQLIPESLRTPFAVTLPAAGAASGRVLTTRRHDDTTASRRLSAADTKTTKHTKRHKEILCESLRATAAGPASPPAGEPLIFNPGFVALGELHGSFCERRRRRRVVASSFPREAQP
jgi:hypothetical protein